MDAREEKVELVTVGATQSVRLSELMAIKARKHRDSLNGWKPPGCAIYVQALSI